MRTVLLILSALILSGCITPSRYTPEAASNLTCLQVAAMSQTDAQAIRQYYRDQLDTLGETTAREQQLFFATVMMMCEINPNASMKSAINFAKKVARRDGPSN